MWISDWRFNFLNAWSVDKCKGNYENHWHHLKQIFRLYKVQELVYKGKLGNHESKRRNSWQQKYCLLFNLDSQLRSNFAWFDLQISKMSVNINRLRFICNEIKRQTECREGVANRGEILLRISGPEGLQVGKYFCSLNWNVGSLGVLGMLQQLRMLTATEFILSKQNSEEQQLVINEFLENEYGLLRNLFISVFYDTDFGIKINDILEEALRRLYLDILANPNLSDLKYLRNITTNLSYDLLLKIVQKHIYILLGLQSNPINDAFRYFTTWINEGVNDIHFMKDVYDKLLCRCSVADSLSYMFKLSSMENFKHWKFYLILLQTISSRASHKDGTFIKKFLNTRLRQIAASPNKKPMLHLFLTVRAVTATTTDMHQNIEAYANWYKQYIGDMKFVLKTEEFQNVLDLLQQCIEYEMEEYYLDIHAAITISPPVLCTKLVQNYKSNCKVRVAELKTRYNEEITSVLVEDSD